MAKYIYLRYALITNYTERFVKDLGNIGSVVRTYGFDAYTTNANGQFVTSGSYQSPSTVGEKYRAANSEENLINHSESTTVGRYLAKIRRVATYVGGDMYELIPNYSRGIFIDEIVAEEGLYPVNGRSGNYWYVRGDRYAPFPQVKVADEMKEPVEGFVMVNGTLRPIVESLIKENGEWKTLV